MMLRCAPLALATSLAAAPVQESLDHERLALRALARHGFSEATPEVFSLPALLERGFVRTRLGLYDLYMPAAAFEDARHVADYRALAATLLDVQGRWLHWLEPASGSFRDVEKELGSLRAWIDGWKPAQLAGAVRGGARDPLVALDAKQRVVDASDAFADFMGLAAALGLPREAAHVEPLVLLHDRESFLELCSLGGWMYPQHRGVFWSSSTVTWTHFYIDEFNFLALQFAASSDPRSGWTAGIRMDARKPNGAAQQIGQLAALALVDNYLGGNVPAAMASSLCVNLVIDVFGECDTRVDGDLRGRRTEAVEVFVPGGNSEGGVLPTVLADSRWRVGGQGADHFVSALRRAQEAGARSADSRRDRLRHFELVSDDGSQRRVVSGPFLGTAAAGTQAPGADFEGDWLEFLRSYGACFVWWLQSESAGSARRSSEVFAELLKELARQEDAGELEQCFARVFDGELLSSNSLEERSLEGRFLAWLAKQR